MLDYFFRHRLFPRPGAGARGYGAKSVPLSRLQTQIASRGARRFRFSGLGSYRSSATCSNPARSSSARNRRSGCDHRIALRYASEIMDFPPLRGHCEKTSTRTREQHHHRLKLARLEGKALGFRLDPFHGGRWRRKVRTLGQHFLDSIDADVPRQWIRPRGKRQRCAKHPGAAGDIEHGRAFRDGRRGEESRASSGRTDAGEERRATLAPDVPEQAGRKLSIEYGHSRKTATPAKMLSNTGAALIPEHPVG